MQAPSASEDARPTCGRARGCCRPRAADGREWLSEPEAKALLRPTACRWCARSVAPSRRGAARGGSEIGYPGGAEDRLARHHPQVRRRRRRARPARSRRALRPPPRRCGTRSPRLRPEARIDGFTVQPMVRRPHAQELIVGASIDPVFGPVILFGDGGIAVEVTADQRSRCRRSTAPGARMVARTRVARCWPATATSRRPTRRLCTTADRAVADADRPARAGRARHQSAVGRRARRAGARARVRVAPRPRRPAPTGSRSGPIPGDGRDA